VIAVIDYGMGNLRSVQKAFEAVGAQAQVTSDLKTILSARSVVLPGVGAFKDCMQNLERLNLVDVVHQSIQSGKPFLGICLGLQLLFNQSEEFGQVAGLGILPGKVVGFPPGHKYDKNNVPLKIPHMGWNTIRVEKTHPLLDQIEKDAYFYFVHSYYVVPEDSSIIATVTDYGGPFVSGIQHENIFAFQFHPEKSQKNGLGLLKRFADLS